MSAYKLRLIASKARRKVAKIAKKEGFASDLCGMCARASAILFNELQENGFAPVLVHGESTFAGDHFYVRCNGYILDITPQQFNYLLPEEYTFPQIIVVKEKTANMLDIGIWNDHNSFVSIEEARIYQIEDNWDNKETISWYDIGE